MKIGETIFEYKGYSYRLQGFYYAYFCREGWQMACVACQPEEANAVSGCGIAGCIAPISAITVLDRKVPNGGYAEEEQSFFNRLDPNWRDSVETLKAKRPGMSAKGFKISEGRAFWKRVRSLF